MIEITIPQGEEFDERTNEFHVVKGWVLKLEHSLISLSKWESTWHKPFLLKDNKSDLETMDYVRCMTMGTVDPVCYRYLTKEQNAQISEYISSPMTATTFSKDNKASKNREVITSEIIYYWMIALNIPFECQTWHLNRLLTLINVCNLKNQPQKKMSQKAILARNRALNESRRSQLNTPG